MFNILYIVAVIATLAVWLDARELRDTYCRMEYCPLNSHTLCRFYTNRQPAQPNCGSVYSTGMTRDEKREVLQAHNRLRAFVASGRETRGINGPQPAASNMGRLRWDRELAEIAQTWANQCDYNHEKCRSVSRGGYGQNLGYEGEPYEYSVNYTTLVQRWYDEVELFDRNIVTRYEYNYKIAHYTQLVWAETTRVGCGAIRYNGPYTEGFKRTYLVCNYGPGGNIDDQTMYQPR